MVIGGEALLLEMLDYLLILQEKGEPAKKLFGDEPRNYCDALIRELPKPQKKSVFRSFIYFGLLCESWALATAGLVGLLGIGDSQTIVSLLWPLIFGMLPPA